MRDFVSTGVFMHYFVEHHHSFVQLSFLDLDFGAWFTNYTNDLLKAHYEKLKIILIFAHLLQFLIFHRFALFTN